jgi:rhamnosyltransferase
VRTFNHGKTRDLAVRDFCSDKPFVIFATQDAIVDGPQALTNLLHSFRDQKVGAAYGRQMPHTGAQSFEAHAALFNYAPPARREPSQKCERIGQVLNQLAGNDHLR